MAAFVKFPATYPVKKRTNLTFKFRAMKTTQEISDEKVKNLKQWVFELEQVLHRKAWNEYVMSCEYDSEEDKERRFDDSVESAMERIFNQIRKL